MLLKKTLPIIRSYFRRYFVIPFKILKISIIDTIKQDGIEHAGYLAFLSILAVFPFLIFLISIIGFFSSSDSGILFIKDILHSLPKEIVKALLPRINEIILGPPQQFLTIAIFGVIWTASSSVEGCRTILNRAYRVTSPPPYILRRLISILEFFVITFLVILGIFTFVIIPRFLKNFTDKFEILSQINFDFLYLRQIAILLLLFTSTSILYYALPSVKQKFTKTFPGAILAVTLWVFLEKLFIFYLKTFHQVNFVYGSLAGVIIALMFFYLVSLVFIIGAEFNYNFYRIYGRILKLKSSWSYHFGQISLEIAT